MKIIRKLINFKDGVIRKIFFFFFIKKYNYLKYHTKQVNIFKTLNLNRQLGKEKLNLTFKDINFHSSKRSMSSEHEVFFSSLSASNDFKINKILEIGTHDGFNSLLLSHLFPNAKVDTIDLQSSDKNFINFYDRKYKIDDFLKKRNNFLSKSSNINFYEMNSLKLIGSKNKYDLIWIDGAHGYPVLCIDIINSLNIINRNGLILCDDVYINKVKNDNMYYSNAAFETLNALSEEKIINFKLIYKRLSAKDNCLEKYRKYIAIIKKTNW